MKLLLYRWSANNEDILRDNLKKLGYEVTECAIKCKNFTADIELASKMIEQIHAESIDGIISFNYLPIISMVADVTGIKYYSWVQDSPHFTLFSKIINIPCNRIGVFDRDMVKTLNNRGIDTVFHLPLPSDVSFWQKQIEAAHDSKSKYRCDVSFVGSLYTDDHNYFDMIFEDDASVMDIIESRCFDYDDDDTFAERLTESGYTDAASERMKELGFSLGADYEFKPSDIIMPAVFEKKVTILERKKLISAVSKMKGIDFRLYTNSKTPIKNRGTVDYHTEMPLVFNQSRINLNITLRSIKSGIPLRVLDIMACGGFVLTNYQSEIAEFFEEDKEVAIFHSMDECMDKIGYYLEHEDERAAIAQAGFVAVKRQFNYGQLEELIKSHS